MAAEKDDIMYEESFIKNSRGLKLFTCKWIPTNQEPKALLFLCHGYAMECSISMNSTARRLVKAGFGVYGMDYEGHGKSDGLSAYIPNFDNLVDDVSTHYTSICEREENKEKMRFLLGESMGGAVVLLLHRKMPDIWDGAVLVAPMCKIAEEIKPSPIVISILTKLISVIPKWKIIPTQDIIELSYKRPEIRKQVRENPLCYKGRPRLKTAYELLRISNDLEKRLEEFALPFMVLHGDDDKVTDKAVSQELYKVAYSSDKTLKLYSGMWHGLLYGETLENIEIVFADVIEWLETRTNYGNNRLESELKHNNDGLNSKHATNSHHDVISIFSDASWSRDGNRAGLGWCFQKHTTILHQDSRVEQFVTSPLVAEALALVAAVKQASDMGLKSVCVKSDSLVLIEAINKGSPLLEIYGQLLDIVILSTDFDAITCTKVDRKFNAKADCIAKHFVALLRRTNQVNQ